MSMITHQQEFLYKSLSGTKIRAFIRNPIVVTNEQDGLAQINAKFLSHLGIP